MKKMMLIVLFVLCAYAAWWVGSRSSTADSFSEDLDGSPTVLGVAETNIPDVITTKIKGRSDSPTAVLPKYACGTGSRCEHAALRAENEEEARWLAGRGYPSADQLAQLESLSIAELMQNASAGDLVAAAVAGEQLIALGRTQEGLIVLHQAATNGSVYADYVAAHAYLNDERLKDRIEGAAYLRRAFLQGDWKATAELYNSLPDISALEMAMADRRAVKLYQGMVSRRETLRKPTILWLRPTSTD